MSQYFDQKNLFLEPQVTQHGSHMVMTDVAKPTKYKFLTVDTRFRDQYDTSNLANYNVSLPERVNSIRSMRARSVELPISYYNISSQQGNNSFQLMNTSSSTSSSIVSETIVLDNKQYNAIQKTTAPWNSGSVLDTINQKLGATGWHSATNMEFTYDSSTRKITLTNKSSVNVRIVFDSVDCVNGQGGSSPSESLMSKLGWLLGFRLSYYDIPSGGSIIGESVVDINGPKYLYLVLDEFKNGNPHSFLGLSRNSQLSSQQILARITPNYQDYAFSENSFPTMFHAECGDHMVSDTRTYGELVNIQRMNVRIVDEFGRVIDLNGLDFSFCLELEHV